MSFYMVVKNQQGFRFCEKFPNEGVRKSVDFELL